MIRFEVDQVWDLSGRGGLLVTGWLRDGVIGQGTSLRDESTRRTWEVLGLEFHAPKGMETLLVARTGAEPPAPGTLLVG
jgi:hypothetical protein